MVIRIITAVIGAAAAFLIISAGGWILTAAAMVIALLGLREYTRMMEHIGKDVYVWPAVVMILASILAASLHSLPLFLAAILFCFIFILGMILFIPQENVSFLFRTATGAVYLSLGMGSFVLLRDGETLLPSVTVSLDTGLFLMWFALLGTWASDSFAYLTGRCCGKHPMAPHISPHKTMEGLAGGVAGTLVVCLLYSAYFGFPLGSGAVLGVLIAVAAPLGDLFESFLKRTCDVKDSGQLLPGHGGMLDRFDSLLFVAPVMVSFLIIVEKLEHL